jgi:pre-60S factor REI1
MAEREYEAQGRNSEEATHRPGINENTLIRKPRMKSKTANSELDTDSKVHVQGIFDDNPEKVPSTRCLFCPFLSPTHTTTLEHMSTHHSLFIPEPSHLYSLDSLLSYLAVLVFDYHECLYCGQEKGTVDAVQTHMRDKGHCMIDMSDLLDFWDLEMDQEYDGDRTDATVTELPNAEKRLPSGLIISPQNSRGDRTLSRLIRPGHVHLRHRASQRRLTKRTASITQAEYQDQETPANPPSSQLALHSNSNDRHLTTIPRTAQGLAGLSDQQIRTLQMVDKRMKSREESAKAKVRYAAQQQPVKTMYYKTENPVYQAG